MEWCVASLVAENERFYGTKITPMVEFIERGVALSSHAFQNHCELCDAVQRVHGKMLMKPVIGHSLQRHANVETPLVGSVRL